MNDSFDLAVVGAGFGGSLLAAIARGLGLSVILIEKSKHPRFAIGEYVPQRAGTLLENLTRKYELPRFASFVDWSLWQREMPRIPGASIDGTAFFHHELGQPFKTGSDPQNPLLIVNDQNETNRSLLWYRAAVDQVFCDEAIAAGAEYLDQTRLVKLTSQPSQVVLEGTRLGMAVEIRAKFIFDASGARGFIHHACGLFNRGLPEFPNTQGLYAHFYGVGRDESVTTVGNAGFGYPAATTGGTEFVADLPAGSNTIVHHVFDGGWMLVQQFNNDLTSAGIAVNDEMAGQLRLANGPKAWKAILDLLPDVCEQFVSARLERPLIYNRRISYLASAIGGPGWAMLPATAGFVDPIMATGFVMTFEGIERLAKLLEKDWGTDRFVTGVAEYATQTENEIRAASRRVAELYECMNDFPRFSDLIRAWDPV